jgi:hypothetical protein
MPIFNKKKELNLKIKVRNAYCCDMEKFIWLQLVQSDDKEGDHVKRCEV